MAVMKTQKKPAERFRQVVDFTNALPKDSLIKSASLAAICVDTGAEAAAEVLEGSEVEIKGSNVSYMVKGGQPGHTYKVAIGVDLSTGEHLEEDVELFVEGPKPEKKEMVAKVEEPTKEPMAKPGVVDEGIWEKAKEAARKTKGEGEEGFYALANHIYQNMGGTFRSKSEKGVQEEAETLEPPATSVPQPPSVDASQNPVSFSHFEGGFSATDIALGRDARYADTLGVSPVWAQNPAVWEAAVAEAKTRGFGGEDYWSACVRLYRDSGGNVAVSQPGPDAFVKRLSELVEEKYGEDYFPTFVNREEQVVVIERLTKSGTSEGAKEAWESRHRSSFVSEANDLGARAEKVFDRFAAAHAQREEGSYESQFKALGARLTTELRDHAETLEGIARDLGHEEAANAFAHIRERAEDADENGTVPGEALVSKMREDMQRGMAELQHGEELYQADLGKGRMPDEGMGKGISMARNSRRKPSKEEEERREKIRAAGEVARQKREGFERDLERQKRHESGSDDEKNKDTDDEGKECSWRMVNGTAICIRGGESISDAMGRKFGKADIFSDAPKIVAYEFEGDTIVLKEEEPLEAEDLAALEKALGIEPVLPESDSDPEPGESGERIVVSYLADPGPDGAHRLLAEHGEAEVLAKCLVDAKIAEDAWDEGAAVVFKVARPEAVGKALSVKIVGELEKGGTPGGAKLAWEARRAAGKRRKNGMGKGADEKELLDKHFVPFVKDERGLEEKGIVYGIVYEPFVVDRQNEWATPEDIEGAAHEYLANHRLVKLNHENDSEDEVVESFIAPCNFFLGSSPVKKGSWIMAVRLTEENREKVKKGLLKGFSMGGFKEFAEDEAILS